MKNKKHKLYCRKVTFDDAKLLHVWINDSLTRKNSLSKNKYISWNFHKKWFKKKLKSKNCTLFIFCTKNEEVGQVRFDKKNKVIKISYSIAKKFGGKGLSKKMLRSAINKYEPKKGNILFGIVRDKNLPSIKVFRSLGFSFNFKNKIYYFSKYF